MVDGVKNMARSNKFLENEFHMWKVENVHSLKLEDLTELRGFSLFNVMVLVLFVINYLFLVSFRHSGKKG